jgi:diadenosine tetraphosphate (Ap4A) HIT family hydrolase
MPPTTTSSPPLGHPANAELADCRFCSRLSEGGPATASETILFESANFVAWPSVGALVPGWVLIVPKRHALALAHLKDTELKELEELRQRVASQLSALGEVIAFEHGPHREGQEVGCGVDHAHLHLVPTRAEILASTRELFEPIDWRPVTSLSSARASLRSGLAYLYVEDQTGRRWLASHPEVPSQLIRRVIAAHLGRAEDYSWRRNPEEGNVALTIEFFERS